MVITVPSLSVFPDRLKTKISRSRKQGHVRCLHLGWLLALGARPTDGESRHVDLVFQPDVVTPPFFCCLSSTDWKRKQRTGHMHCLHVGWLPTLGAETRLSRTWSPFTFFPDLHSLPKTKKEIRTKAENRARALPSCWGLLTSGAHPPVNRDTLRLQKTGMNMLYGYAGRFGREE